MTSGAEVTVWKSWTWCYDIEVEVWPRRKMKGRALCFCIFFFLPKWQNGGLEKKIYMHGMVQ